MRGNPLPFQLQSNVARRSKGTYPFHSPATSSRPHLCLLDLTFYLTPKYLQWSQLQLIAGLRPHPVHLFQAVCKTSHPEKLYDRVVRKTHLIWDLRKFWSPLIIYSLWRIATGSLLVLWGSCKKAVALYRSSQSAISSNCSFVFSCSYSYTHGQQGSTLGGLAPTAPASS